MLLMKLLTEGLGTGFLLRIVCATGIVCLAVMAAFLSGIMCLILK